MIDIMVLNDGDTYTALHGCEILSIAEGDLELLDEKSIAEMKEEGIAKVKKRFTHTYQKEWK